MIPVYSRFGFTLVWFGLVWGTGWGFCPGGFCPRPLVWYMVFKSYFNNISVILWRSVLLVDETGENHWGSNSQL
jgi:hypothetical protein